MEDARRAFRVRIIENNSVRRAASGLSTVPTTSAVLTNWETALAVTHRREDNNRVRFLMAEEEKKLRKAIESKWASHLPELDLAINTGLRKGSKYSLTWDMVDFKGRMLNIPRTKNEEPIRVPLNDFAVAALRVVLDRVRGERPGVSIGQNRRAPGKWEALVR